MHSLIDKKLSVLFRISTATEQSATSDSDFASETNFNALTCTFSMTSNSQIDDPAYALAGSLFTTIKKDSGVTRDIYYLKIASF